MSNTEDLIREQRITEATQKNYMGLQTGKFGCILLYLGEPINSQTNDFQVQYLDDYYYESEDDGELPYLDETALEYTSGYFFDGLSRGLPIEIMSSEGDMKVRYKGNLVYLEQSGDLECFVPNQEWEDIIERLFAVAYQKQKAHKKVEGQKRIEEKEKNDKNWFNYLKTKWGFH